MTAPRSAPPSRAASVTVVINELLALNSGLPLESDGDRNSDWVELFNAGAVAVSLHGWRLRYAEPGGPTNEFAFPPTAFFGPKTHLLVIFSETRRTLYHTGFRLSSAGGTVWIIDPSGVAVDSVQYGVQQANVSFGRYRDGALALAFNQYPSPRRPNTDNGPAEPIARLDDYAPVPARPDEPIRFTITARDDVGVMGVSVLWQRLDVLDTNVHRAVLYDDGQHDDGGMLDGVFSGLLQPGLPEGAELQFCLEVTDLSEQTVYLPGEPVFAPRGQPLALYSLTVDKTSTRSPLELSEIVAGNTNGLRDELGRVADWVEIRNCSENPVPLRGVSLARNFFADGARYDFADGEVLQPAEHRVIFCDNTPTNRLNHAPFNLNRDGDQVVLTGRSVNGARTWLDSVAFGPQASDAAYARLGSGGPWWTSPAPTPGAGNVSGAWLGRMSVDRSLFTLAFPTTTNASYVVEFTDSLTAPEWTAQPIIAGDGIEKTLIQEVVGHRFFRVRRLP